MLWRGRLNVTALFLWPHAIRGALLLLGALVAWPLAVLVVVSALEGRWGVTPGKWVAGIRTFGTDLSPCGFWRAVLRNFLRLVDGMFVFLPAILLVAFSERWQRIGGMAARTVVVRTRT